MASGIDWFRWHHGSVTDPKFQLVAKKSGASVAEVVAVWACILEASSSAEVRGEHGHLDFEAIDCALGLDDGCSSSIYSHMESRGLVSDGCVCAWEKRQPKRERTDDNSSERVKAFRERKRQETPCNDEKRQETPREEKRREEVNTEANASVTGKPDDLLIQPEKIREIPENPAKAQCPADAIVALYHELMPDNPRVKVLDDKRRGSIRARWKQAASLTCQPFGYSSRESGLAAWRTFFEVCAESDFLTGKAPPMRDKPPFVADIDFLMSPSGFAKCLENKYHRDREAA